jgi:hypothetical protein
MACRRLRAVRDGRQRCAVRELAEEDHVERNWVRALFDASRLDPDRIVGVLLAAAAI